MEEISDKDIMKCIKKDPFFLSVMKAITFMEENPMNNYGMDDDTITIFDVVNFMISNLKDITKTFFL